MILQYPLSTEKSVKMIEMENKITFVVDRRASRKEIEKEFFKEFGVKPLSINVHLKGNKKIAFIKLRQENPAIDIATKLGLM